MLSLLGVFLLVCALDTQAQQIYDRWCFSYNMGIDFTSSGAIFNSANSIASAEGCTSVCDENGKLLFYASPESVWDSTHNIMPNGDSLDGHISAKLGVFSVPVPGSPQEHYVFTTDAGETYPFEMETRYSIVNMTLNGGLGDVESGSKNTLLFDHDPFSAEEIVGCEMAGYTEGFWLFLRKANEIPVFKITSTGIIYHLSYHADLTATSGTQFLGLSRTGRYLIVDGTKQLDSVPWKGIVLVKFDPVNGSFSEELFIPITSNLSNGGSFYAEFSPSERFLYCNFFDVTQNNSYVFSLDLNIWDGDSILQSIDTVGVLNNKQLFQFKLGVNDTIYINRELDSTFSIATIGNPDQINSPAVFEAASFPVQLNPLSQHGIGLPNTLKYGKPDFEARFTCLGDSTWFVFFGLADSLRWNFNDPNAGSANFSEQENPYFQFSQSGTFNIQLIAYWKTRIDTITHTVVITDTLPEKVFGSGQATLCGINDSVVFDFSAFTPTLVLWNDSVSTISRSINDTGIFSVLVANACDTIKDTLTVKYRAAPNISLSDTILCVGSQISLEPNDSIDNFLWSTGDTTASITIDTSLSLDLEPIEIWLTATNACGTTSDTMTVTFLPTPDATLPSDSAHCLDQSFFIFHENAASVNYLWSDSTSEERFRLDSSMTVWLSAENECGIDRDTFNVVFHPEIKTQLGEDTLICNGDNVVLDATWPGANYVWSTGSEDSSITASEADIYIVTISSPPCQKVESRAVSIIEEDCDSIDCKFSIPNVFTPNADGINDVLRITNRCESLSFTVFIYNRWGQLVFSDKNSLSGVFWDGFVNGEAASAGTYFVIASYDDGKTQRGSVTLSK
ncbi:MAG: gliding motility-associated C-terminal domain-containing protein [Salibacteraceae bacterium]